MRAPPDASRYRFRRPGTARSPVAPDRGTQFFSPTLADSRFPMRISFVTGVLCTNFQMAKESASIEPTIKKQKVPVPLAPHHKFSMQQELTKCTDFVITSESACEADSTLYEKYI